MLGLNDPLEEALTAVLSPAENKAAAQKARLAGAPNAPRTHPLPREKDSAAIWEVMGVLDSINAREMAEGERCSISCATEHT